MYLQINTVRYDADREITNIYENLKIVWSQILPICYYSFIFGLLQISIGLSVFRFTANEYKLIAIQLFSTICNIQSAIWWAITKVILNYLPLPRDRYPTLFDLFVSDKESKVLQPWQLQWGLLNPVSSGFRGFPAVLEPLVRAALLAPRVHGEFTRWQCYKTFYGRKLRLSMIS